MTFGDLILYDNGLIYPNAADAEEMLYLRRGDGGYFVAYDGKMLAFMGDGTGKTIGETPVNFLLSSVGVFYSPTDPLITQDYNYVVDGSNHVYSFFKQILGWKDGGGYTAQFTTHLGGSSIDLGGRLVSFTNIIYSYALAYNATHRPVYTGVYYTDDKYSAAGDNFIFLNKAGGAALSESDFDTSVLWDWDATNTVRFSFPNVCKTLFDSKGRPVLTSSYFEIVKDISGKPLYQNYRAVPDNETLYAYVYGQHSDSSVVGGNGALVARVKVYESGAWLNAGTDPIFNGSTWEFWNGYFWGDDMEEARAVTDLVEYQFFVDVQFDPHRNKFIMLRSQISDNFYTDGWDENTVFKTSILESDTPYGIFTNEKVLVLTDYDEDRKYIGGATFFGILEDRLVVTASFAYPAVWTDYNTDPVGAGAYFGSVPIT